MHSSELVGIGTYKHHFTCSNSCNEWHIAMETPWRGPAEESLLMLMLTIMIKIYNIIYLFLYILLHIKYVCFARHP